MMRTDDWTKPPAPFRQTSPYTLELRESSGCMAAFGLPFFLAGIFMIASLTRLIPYEATPGGKWTPVVLGLMSLVFLAVGGILLFGRRWFTVDIGNGSVIRQQGLLIPMRREERRLNEFTAVVLAFDRGDSDSPERYPVRLRASSGKDFVISTPAQFGESRNQAEFLSRFLRLPLADATTDHETLVTPERASDSLRDRLRSGGEEFGPSTPPLGMLSEVAQSPGEARIIIRNPRFPLAGVLGTFAPVVILLILLPGFRGVFARNQSTRGVQIVFLAFVLIPGIPFMVGGVNLIVGSRRRKTTVTASREGLLIERRSAWRTRTERVSASDILDLDCSTFDGALESVRAPSQFQAVPGATAARIFSALRTIVFNKGIVVKCRQEIIAFGEGLSTRELEYLKSVLRKALAN